MKTSDLRARYGEWAVITGAPFGIGQTFAEKLAASRIHLVLAARRIELLERLSEKLNREHGVSVRCVEVDLTRNGCSESLLEACEGLDVGLVIDNAGSGVPGLFSSTDLLREKDLFRLNCVTPVEITRHFLPAMLSNRKGGIILVSSLMGFQGVPYMACYSATKGFLLNFGEALHHECKKSGVDVLVLAPGATDTPGKDLHDVDYSKLPIRWLSPESVVDAALKSLGRKALVVPGFRNHLTACSSGGLWSRGWVQGFMRKLGRRALPESAS